jgi:hypothetical protein
MDKGKRIGEEEMTLPVVMRREMVSEDMREVKRKRK